MNENDYNQNLLMKWYDKIFIGLVFCDMSSYRVVSGFAKAHPDTHPVFAHITKN